MILDHLLVFVSFIFGILLISCRAEKGNINADLPQNKIEVRDAWARPAKLGMTGGAYLTIANGMENTDTLVSVTTNAALITEIHQSYEKDGVSGMRPVGELPIEARSITELKPGGYHIMMMQLSRDLTTGDSISLRLLFSQYGSVKLNVPVSGESQNHIN
ncbi:copper chaperone PCu(A)C [Aliifodinibius sp. S!AR15-10]|uniref:copper chaperone PCu(A)C n=1 Tax=Aliifodinibius sp. S!AR15-10 TaxID=2950437 RepID=UPI002856E8F0|nr:copper chaperone PCu(A)C [Aliifodinibius sp. S!AR15-10]MDR8391233.1 copper chaperone PCu(A)C [Aliifodinibius sp. S!AR15-10]